MKVDSKILNKSIIMGIIIGIIIEIIVAIYTILSAFLVVNMWFFNPDFRHNSILLGMNYIFSKCVDWI